MALPHLHGHSRSLIVSTASAKHGASIGAWVGTPSEWIPRDMYNPALARGLHGRARGGVSGHSWASVGLTRPYLKAGCTWIFLGTLVEILQDG